MNVSHPLKTEDEWLLSLTANSKITAKVNAATEGAPYAVDEKQACIATSKQYMFADEDFREKLALSIGLKRVPDLDPSSFDRIQGILSEHIDSDFDAEEMVREVRSC